MGSIPRELSGAEGVAGCDFPGMTSAKIFPFLVFGARLKRPKEYRCTPSAIVLCLGNGGMGNNTNCRKVFSG